MTRSTRLLLKLGSTVALIGLLAGQASAATLTLSPELIEGAPGSEVEVPIVVGGSKGLEGLQFLLTFDPSVVRNIGVQLGPLAGAGELNVKVREPGKLRIAMYPEKAINGDGTLLVARFEVLGAVGGSTAIELADARAWEFGESRPLEMLVAVTSGGVTVVRGLGLPRGVLLIGVGVLLLLVVGTVMTRRSRSA